MNSDEAVATKLPTISNVHEYRDALARIRMLDRAADGSPERRERVLLELALSRFLSASKPLGSTSS